VNASLPSLIDALLPQTQCTRCGYPTCRAYAEAIATREADINRCPPGGFEGIVALATLLGVAPKPLDPSTGAEGPPLLAVIDESICIGCMKCIQACPVDAIVGAAKRMHTVIATECTGCELCVPPCPVDCIALVAVATAPLSRARVMQRAAHARARFDARAARLARGSAKQSARRATAESKQRPRVPITREAVLEAIARGKARRASLRNGPRR
jgi:electron transport complex protein RnfB